MNETNRIEFKKEYSKDLELEREVVAFLNYREGGYIYIGIDKHGRVVGVNQDVDEICLKIKDRIKDNILPSALGLFDIAPEEIKGKTIIKITIASGSEKPYYIKRYGMSEKGSFVRSGTAVQPMSQRMIDDLYAGRTRNSIGKIVSNRQELSFEQLRIYYQEKGKPLTKNFAITLELKTEDKRYNYVAYLLADENGNSIKFAKYKGTNRVDLISNEEFGYESLIKATKRLLDRLDTENITSTKITGKERISKRLWDEVAVREAVLNAMVHNDYTTEVPPKFELFSDRLEITSSGTLPERMTKEEFFEGVSVPRNKELMRVYRDLELVEQLGSGVPRIVEKYGKEAFVFLPHFIRMVFYFEKPNETVNNENDTVNRENDTVNNENDTLNKRIEALRENLPETKGKVLDRYILILKALSNGEYRTKELMEYTSVSRSTIKRDLEVLISIGQVKTEGVGKGLYYKLVPMIN